MAIDPNETFYQNTAKEFITQHTDVVYFSWNIAATDDDLLPLGGIESIENTNDPETIEKRFYNTGGGLITIKTGNNFQVVVTGTVDLNDAGQQELFKNDKLLATGSDAQGRVRIVTRYKTYTGIANLFPVLEGGTADELKPFTLSVMFEGNPVITDTTPATPQV